MEIKYLKKSVIRINQILFVIVMATFGAAFAQIYFDRIFSNQVFLLLAVVLFILILVIAKKEQVTRKVAICELGLVDHLGTLYYRDIKRVVCGRDKIEMVFDNANVSTKYDEALVEILKTQQITLVETKRSIDAFSRLFVGIFYVIGIYFFYNLFVLIFGTIYCVQYHYQIINTMGMFIRSLKLVSVLLAIVIYGLIKNKKVAMASAIAIVGSLIILGYLVDIDKYRDYYGSFACVMENGDLNIYQDVIHEYGLLGKTFKNVNDYSVANLTSHEKVVIYNGVNTGQYIVHQQKKKDASMTKIFSYYNGKTYRHDTLELTFSDNKIEITDLHGQKMDYDQLKLVNGYILEVYQQDVVVNCIVFNEFRDYGPTITYPKISLSQINEGKFALYNMNDVTNEQMEPEPEEEVETNEVEENEVVVTDEIRNDNGKKLVNKMNSIAQEIDSFESTQEFIKIKVDSSDYNTIVLEAAKQFTINNNTDKKIDTQILSISITAGNLDEFAVRTYDRQDIAGEEKRKNEYYYRIKKVGAYYLAARVKNDCDVNVGLTLLQPAITTDTSQTTDYLYRIDGKKYLGNRWGNIGG